jgi:hypothetical protein
VGLNNKLGQQHEDDHPFPSERSEEAMNETVDIVPPVAESRGGRVSRYLALLVPVLSLVLSIAALTLAFTSARTSRRELHELETRTQKAVDEAAWSAAADRYNASENSVQPEVGSIQFTKRGYSVQFGKVVYGSNGLQLEGLLGNPTNLWLSNVTIQFTARKPIYTAKGEFLKARPDSIDRFFAYGEQLGIAQTQTIASLPPGQSHHFEVTVPNVKQTKEGIDLTADFTGERYSYSP